jgi:hypothetical protein
MLMIKLFKLHFTNKQQLQAGLILATIFQLISLAVGAITLVGLPLAISLHVAFAHTLLSFFYALLGVKEKIIFFPKKKVKN